MQLALVELEARLTRDGLLQVVHEMLERLALGGEPEPVVDHLGIRDCDKLITEMRDLTVERQRLDRPMGVMYISVPPGVS